MESHIGTIKEGERLTGTITEAIIIKQGDTDMELIEDIELTGDEDKEVTHDLGASVAFFQLLDENSDPVFCNKLRPKDENTVIINHGLKGTYKLLIIYKKN